jgi:hypothetical protein
VVRGVEWSESRQYRKRERPKCALRDIERGRQSAEKRRLSKRHFGSHPHPVFSISYRLPKHFHGGNTGSNPSGTAHIGTQVVLRRALLVPRIKKRRTIGTSVPIAGIADFRNPRAWQEDTFSGSLVGACRHGAAGLFDVRVSNREHTRDILYGHRWYVDISISTFVFEVPTPVLTTTGR